MKKFLVLLLVILLLVGCSKPANNQPLEEDPKGETIEENTDNTSLKEFNDMFSGNLIPSIDYFNENIDKFTEEEKLNFAKKIVGVIETSGMKYSQYGEFEFTRAEGFEFAPPFIISSAMFDFYEYETNEFNLEYFKNNDNHYLSTLSELKDDDLFTLCTLFFADIGNLEGGYFSVTLEPEVSKKILPALNVVYKDKYGEYNLPVRVANIIFKTVENVITDKNISYPKVLVDNFEDAKKFDEAETFKSEIYLPVNFVNKEIPKKEDKKETDTVHASTLSVGDTIDGHRISSLDLSNDKFMISLDGIYEVKGELHYNEDYWGGYVFYPIVENTTKIEFDFYYTEDFKETFSIEPPSGSFFVDDSIVKDSLGKDTANKIRNGEIMIITVKMNGFSFGAHYESESYNDTVIESITIDGTKNDSDDTKIFENKFESETINGEFIDYNEYTAVIVPMYSGINFGEWAPLEMKKVWISDNDKTEVSFAVFGTMKNVTITNIENMGDEGTSEHIDIITDSKVRVFCKLPNDMSTVKVSGYVEVGSEEHKVEFTLDDMRDADAYKVLLFK